MNEKPFLTSNDVAKLLRVSPVTVRQWAQKGLLQAECTPGGHRRFVKGEVERFAGEHGISLHDPDAVLRILIVDDDKHIAEYLSELLSGAEEQLKIATAYDGFDAGRQVHSLRPHVMLLDLMMPGMDGFEVCRTLKQDETTKSTRIIAMTGFPSPENIERILDAGAEACLSKPLDSAAVFNAIGITDSLSLHTA